MVGRKKSWENFIFLVRSSYLWGRLWLNYIDMQMLLVFIAAVLPAIVLLYYIYNKDKEQPEPTSLILRGFWFGILSVFVSLLLSLLSSAVGLYSFDDVSTWGEAVRVSFFGAAIPEELAKLFMLWLLLRKNPYFDEHVDGIVYAVAISMGFAALENVGYLFVNYDSWQAVGTTRALVSVPAHYAFAVFMGYYYSMCHFSQSDKAYYGIMAVAMPILFHGLFDSLLFMMPMNESYAVILLVVFSVFCYNMHKLATSRIKDHLETDRRGGMGC